MQAASGHCNTNARFLAALGGAWLEIGDTKQALIWLERALMLEPLLESAQADYALALAVLGEPTALDELTAAWKGRTDVPPALWRRMTETAQHGGEPTDNGVAAMARRYLIPSTGWQHLREVQVQVGHENNLGQSPTLGELRLTPADGPISLPLSEPLKAQRGDAAMLDLSWQAATSNSAQQSLLVGVQAVGRHTPNVADTDWHSLRLALSVGQRFGDWRWRLQTRLISNGGPLNEASRQTKWAIAAEGPLGPCSQRWALESDKLRYQNSALNNTATTAVVSSVLCPSPWSGKWAVGASARGAAERATDDQRPGGNQRHSGMALRLLGDISSGGPADVWTLDSQWHLSRAKDEIGYSVLLENNARRFTKTQMLSVELTGPVFRAHQTGARTVIQVQLGRQNSNLELFSFETESIYAGFRFQW